MNKTIDQMLNRPRIALIFIAFISLCALSFAYISEYFFGLQPCVLCIYQRVPFFIVLMIGFFGFVIHQNRICLLALGLSALAFFVNTGIAVFHSGVERKMWEGTDACGGADISTMTSLADLKASILAARNEVDAVSRRSMTQTCLVPFGLFPASCFVCFAGLS